MLQQTQVKTVVPYWERWMRHLPDVQALARVSEARVFKLWEGLGYYSRARNLQRAAALVVGEHGGRFPEQFDAVLALPGIGRYTAGAVASFAFERPTAAVDTNVARVLRRAFHPRARRRTLVSRVWETAELLVPRRGKNAWSFNQGIMELGALVCTARIARCGQCPVRSACATGRRRVLP